jgi:F-type H+-transporting ATPase subunit gamma
MIPLRDIRSQIQSIRKISHITRAMKTVSAIRLRRVQGQVVRQRPYALKLRDIVADLVQRTAARAHPLLREARKSETAEAKFEIPDSKRETPVVLLVLGSDRGLCGAFNNNLMAESLKFQYEYSGRELQTVVFGKKLIDLMQSHHRPMSRKLPGFFQGMTYDKVAALAREFLEQYLAGRIGELWVVFTEFRSTARQKVKAEQILPIGVEKLPAEPLFPEYRYEPDEFAVLDEILPMYYNREWWRVFLESEASEHITRMRAMDMATVNAGEMIDDLTLVLNKARQELITRELSEISTSAEALRAG